MSTSSLSYSLLMWPVTKIGKWKDASFDIMVGVASAKHPEHEIFGWIWKHAF